MRHLHLHFRHLRLLTPASFPRILLCVCALALAPHTRLRAQTQTPLRDTDIAVHIACVPDGLPLRVAIGVTDAKPAGQFVQVAITNTSGRDITLTQLTARIPRPRPAAGDALIATGAWDMGRTQTRVWPAATTEKLESGTFVASHSETTGATTLAGFVTWKTFDSKILWQPDALLITADGENRLLKPGETISMEKLWLAQIAPDPARARAQPARAQPAPAWSDLFYAYADQIASENRIHLNPVKPRVGWGTWDYYGFGWNQNTIKAATDALAQIAPNANLVQIDAGWGGPGGDHMTAHPRLGADGLGMQRIATLLHAKNIEAGTYFCPMRDAPNSTLARGHPEYFLKDAAGKTLASDPGTNKKDRVNIFYDYSNPATCDYIRRAIATSRAWGFTYFKTDFLRDGLAENIRKVSAPGAQIVPSDPALTSVERFHRGMAAIREGMGPGSYFLSCSAVFGPSFGHADALRAGDDISPKWRSYQKCATDNSGSFYLHEKVIHIDTDYIVVRAAQDQDATRVDSKGKDGANLALNEAQMWAHFVALCGSARISSDALPILRPERRALLQFAAAFPAPERFIPLDFWRHARAKTDPPAVILATAKGDCYLGLFNWTDAAKTITLAGLPPAQLAALATISGEATIAKNAAPATPATAPAAATATATAPLLALMLKPRHSAILKLPAADFDTLRRAIVVNP